MAQLEELYGLKDDESIARELHRPVRGVRSMARRLFPSSSRTGPWSADDLATLKRYYGGAPLDVVARVLRRSQADVERRVEELRTLQHSGRWTQEEVVELKRLFGTRTDSDLALIFGRRQEAIRRQATRLCLAKDKVFLKRLSGPATSRMPRWHRSEVEKLVTLYPVAPNLAIAQKLNRSVKSVVSKAHNLGLRKEADRLREMGRENVSLRYRRSGAAGS
jgi:hypothetical protein